MTQDSALYRGIAEFLRGRVLVVGVGNSLRGDDRAGPAVVERVGRVLPECCLDCGEAPENYLGVILERGPQRVLFVDAVDFGGQPGEARMCDWSQMRRYGWDTHRFPLRAVAQYLSDEGRMETGLLGIQPARIDFGAAMTAAVKAAVESVGRLITRALRAQGAHCFEAKPV